MKEMRSYLLCANSQQHWSEAERQGKFASREAAASAADRPSCSFLGRHYVQQPVLTSTYRVESHKASKAAHFDHIGSMVPKSQLCLSLASL